MLESEAKTKWCPMVRIAKGLPGGIVNHGQAVFNRIEDADGDACKPASSGCIGSGCMMWVDHEKTVPQGHCGLAVSG